MYLKLNDFFPDFVNEGIFTFLDDFPVPWKEPIEYTALNLEYHGNYSGDKIVSPLLNRFTPETLQRDKLSGAIWAMYATKWGKLWETLNLEYNPIENYRMTENESGNNSVTGSETGTETTNRTGDYRRTSNGQADNGIFGFNSSTAVNADTAQTSVTNQDNNTDSGTVAETRSNINTGTHERELTRSGNIGVTTSQQMIESERELWQWVFFENVFKDLDKILTIQIY